MTELTRKIHWTAALVLALFSFSAQAGVNHVISKALKDHTGASRVEVISILGVIPAQPLDRATSASVLSENAAGEARVLVSGFRAEGKQEERAEYRIKYAAWVKSWTVNRRIAPGESLSAEAIEIRDFNVAESLAREYRGAFLSMTEDPARLEAAQTLLPGSFIPAAAVRRIPDLRRGDAVILEVISGGVRLTAPATALESTSLLQKVRVQSQKTKREFVGILREGQRVEVTL